MSSEPVPKHPSLYRLSADRQAVELWFARCGNCGHDNFPASVYGCGNCGATREQFQMEARPAAGRLLACVTVHANLSPALTPPQSVADIEIAPGIVEEVLVGEPSDSLTPGQHMIGRAILVGEQKQFDCIFFAAP